jgi:hypothetical protein
VNRHTWMGSQRNVRSWPIGEDFHPRQTGPVREVLRPSIMSCATRHPSIALRPASVMR